MVVTSLMRPPSAAMSRSLGTLSASRDWLPSCPSSGAWFCLEKRLSRKTLNIGHIVRTRQKRGCTVRQQRQGCSNGVASAFDAHLSVCRALEALAVTLGDRVALSAAPPDKSRRAQATAATEAA